jgi:hypothetical protein
LVVTRAFLEDLADVRLETLTTRTDLDLLLLLREAEDYVAIFRLRPA